MKRVIKSQHKYIYSSTEEPVRLLSAASIPYVIEFIEENTEIISDTTIYVNSVPFGNTELVEQFEDKLQNEFSLRNYSIVYMTPNEHENSLYYTCCVKDPSELVKIYCEMMFTFRFSTHEQNTPYQGKTKTARDENQSTAISNLKRLYPEADPIIPDIDYSVVIKKSTNSEGINNFGSDMDAAVKFIVDDIDSYVNEEIQRAISSGKIKEDFR